MTTHGLRLSFLPLLSLACALSQAQDPAPPGQLIDVGGRRLHMNCAGSGSPTVIVLNGGGSFSVEWALIIMARRIHGAPPAAIVG